MIRFSHIAFVLLAALLVCSCRAPKKIPREDMEEIFYLMFMQDQRIKQDRSLKREADTSQVYAGILKSKGYNTNDYIYSLNYYLEEPEKMEKVMAGVEARLEKELKVVNKEMELERWRAKMLAIYGQKIDTSLRPMPGPRPVDTLKIRFDGDSAYMHKLIDSLKLIPRDSLIFLRDTVTVVQDTLEVSDSLAVADTLAVRDSL